MRADEFGSFGPECYIEKIDGFMLDFDVKFDGELQPDLSDIFPGTAAGGRLSGPIDIGESCAEQIDEQIYACKAAQQRWHEQHNEDS